MQPKALVYRKKGYLTYGESDTDVLTMKFSISSVKINRARDTAVSEATIMAEFEHLPMAEYQGGNTGILDNFAFMEIYFDGLIEFTGVIKKYYYDDNEKIVTLTCHDMMYRLLNAIPETLTFANTTAVGIITSICNKLGLTVNHVGGDDYAIDTLALKEGTVALDFIQSMLETMHAIIRCTKNGIIQIEAQYPDYTEGAGDANHFDWTYKDETNVSTSNAGRDASEMKNILRVTCDNHYTKFEDPSMTSYLNGEQWYEPDAENAVANTQTKRKAVAGYLYLDMWRKSTPLTILPTVGNRYIDMGQVIKLIRDNTDPGYYLVVGIDTEVAADNYQDNLQLQGMRDKNTIYQIPVVLAEGVIDTKLDDVPQANANEVVTMQVYTGDVSSTGYNDLGYVDIPEDTPAWSVSMTCLDKFVDGSNDWGYTLPDLDIIDPDGVEYGWYGSIVPFCPVVGQTTSPAEGYVESTNITCGSKITYSGTKSNPEQWYVYSPKLGRWKFRARSFCDTTHPTKLDLNIQSSLKWTKVNNQGQTSI